MEIRSRACCSAVSGSDCHCARCHQTFSSLRLFDRHQDVDYKRTKPLRCIAPAELELVRNHRGVWATREASKTSLRLAEAASRGIREVACASP